jgi:two-component system nitrogen regulation response regulator GlnG/two-component system response regulator HydG
VSGSGNTTVPSSTDDLAGLASAPRLVPSLAIAWSKQQPERVGEVALLDGGNGSTWTLGRDDEGYADAAARVRFFRQRPGSSVDAGPLTGEKISRSQLRLRRSAAGLELENIGKGVVLLDGKLVEAGWRPLKPGGVIMLRGHSVFLHVMRPLALPVPRRPVSFHDFGEPDADDLVGEAPPTWELRENLAAAVRTFSHVLLRGPSGTGKELVAHAIHRRSGRRGAFVAANAAAITPSLADSALFGNAANYPNPGTPERLGLIGEAQGGTLFLDEIGELPEELQARLLRAVEGEYMRLGESKVRRSDILLVGATNRGLSRVKHDLRKRFGYVLEMPPLSARLEDVPLLARSLVLQATNGKMREAALPFVYEGATGRAEVHMAPALILAMLKAPLDGNVRDIRNILGVAMAEGSEPPLMPPADMSQWVLPTIPPPAAQPPAQEEVPGAEELLDGFGPTKGDMLSALDKHGWHLGRTADGLHMSRDQLKRRMKKFGIERPKG